MCAHPYPCPAHFIVVLLCTEKEMKTTRRNETDKKEFSFNDFSLHCLMIAKCTGVITTSCPLLLTVQLGLKKYAYNYPLIFGYFVWCGSLLCIWYYRLPITKGPNRDEKRRWCQVSAYRCTHSHDYLIILICVHPFSEQ